MVSLELILQRTKGSSLREQVEAAHRAHQLNPAAREERKKILRRLHGCLSEADGIIFEEAMADSRRVEVNA